MGMNGYNLYSNQGFICLKINLFLLNLPIGLDFKYKCATYICEKIALYLLVNERCDLVMD